jgi:hypothetical protein
MLEFSKPDFTQIDQQMWKLRVEILVNSSVKCYVTVPKFTKLTRVLQLTVKNSDTELFEDPTNGFVPK